MSAATIITGASSGIGAALARQLAALPDCGDLILVGRDRQRLDETARACRGLGAAVQAIAMDQTERHSLFAAIDAALGGAPVSRLFACAGVLEGRGKGEVTETPEAAARVIDTNLAATVDLVYKVLPDMRARRQGEITLVSSLAAFSPIADAPAYSASKAGLVAFAIALRDAVAEDGIQVMVSCPGYVDTAMGAVHIGKRPHELSAEVAASQILSVAESGRGLSGFPFMLYWLARFALLAPEPIRRLGAGGLRFHVGDKHQTRS